MGKQKQLMMLEPIQRRGRQQKNKIKSNKKKNNNNIIKNDLFYWAREVRMKYNYHCVYCNASKHLSAHHIFPKAKFKGLTYNLNNGILMCYDCHIELHQLNDPLEGTIHP